MRWVKQCVAEGLGTFFLCFAAIASILCTWPPIKSGFGLLGIATAQMLALTVAIQCFSGLSGAHFNPAVTIALLTTRRIRPALALAYVLSQLAAATLAALVCNMIFPEVPIDDLVLGLPMPASWTTENSVLSLEFIMTFFLMLSYYGTAIDTRGPGMKIGAFGISLSLAFGILIAGSTTGAALNPARSFGPALVMQRFDSHWCYWVAPVVGAILAAQIYEHFLLPEPDAPEVEPLAEKTPWPTPAAPKSNNS